MLSMSSTKPAPTRLKSEKMLSDSVNFAKTKWVTRGETIMKKPAQTGRPDRSVAPRRDVTVKCGRTSRREFLQATAAGVLTSSVLGAGCDTPLVLDDGIDTGTETGGPPVIEVGERPENRVVRVVDSGATTWTPENGFADFFQYADQTVVDPMVERGLLALTGADSLETAWRDLVPYETGQTVAIHVNGFVHQNNHLKNNVAQPVSAIVHGLVDLLGVPPSKVAVSDPSRELLRSEATVARLIEPCRYADELSWDRQFREYGSSIRFTVGHVPPGTFQISRLMEEADHIILVPVLSWHAFNWMTGALKLLMGSVTPMGNLHPGGEAEVYDWREGARLADIAMPLKHRIRLILADGLFGNTVGNDQPPHPFETLGGNGGEHPSSTLYMSRDPVATDCVMYDDLLDEARAAGDEKNDYATGFLRFAADDNHKLGTFEMRNLTGETTYKEIEIVDA